MRRVLRLVARSDVEDEQSYRRERREWYYLPIRRLLLFLEHSIGRATRWVVFEPKDDPARGADEGRR